MIDANIPLRAGEAGQVNLVELMRQAQDYKLRNMQVQEAQQKTQAEQERKGALVDLMRGAQGGQLPTEGPAFDRYRDADPEGAFEMMKGLDAERRKHVEEGLKDMSAAVQWADTPEKWAQVQQHYAQYSPEVAQVPFEQREAALMKLGQLGKYLTGGGEQYTLAPGSRRFDAQGRMIAEAPFAPRPVTVGEGQTAVEYVPGGGGSVIDKIAGIEGAGKNPKSSAAGYGQFIDSTFVKTFRDTFPDRAGMSDAQILAQRGSGVERPMLEKLTANNTAALQNAGIAPDPGNVYLAHFLGAGGATQVLSASPDASLVSIVGPKVIAANSFLRGMTAGDVKAWADRKMAGGGGRVIAQGAPKQPKEKWRQLSPQEAQTMGLPPGVYQQSPDGEVKPVGGQGGNAAKGSPQEQAKGAQMALQAAGVSENADPVSELIKSSTSGRLQAGAARLWSDITGDATDGMESIARLKTIGNDMVLQASGGSLGAQISNSDRDFMAARFGDIGNPELTVDERLAAWDQVKKRLNALAKAAPQAATPPTGSKRLRYNPATGELE